MNEVKREECFTDSRCVSVWVPASYCGSSICDTLHPVYSGPTWTNLLCVLAARLACVSRAVAFRMCSRWASECEAVAELSTWSVGSSFRPIRLDLHCVDRNLVWPRVMVAENSCGQVEIVSQGTLA